MISLTPVKMTFADVFGSGYSPQDCKVTTSSHYEMTQSNVYVHDCTFNNCISTTYGGAISCLYKVTRLLIDKASFTSCKANNDAGGAIFFYNTASSHCVICRICGYDCELTCSTLSHGQCVNIAVYDGLGYKNQFNDSSVTKSIKDNSYFAVDLQHGNIICNSDNISNNKCTYISALICVPRYANTNPITCYVSYLSIVNNTATSSQCIVFDCSETTQQIDTCNIINNVQSVSNVGMIITYGYLTIKSSCIVKNNRNGYTFDSEVDGKIKIYNCTLDDDILLSSGFTGSFTIISTIKRSFVNPLLHFSTKKCDSFLDSNWITYTQLHSYKYGKFHQVRFINELRMR